MIEERFTKKPENRKSIVYVLVVCGLNDPLKDLKVILWNLSTPCKSCRYLSEKICKTDVSPIDIYSRQPHVSHFLPLNQAI